jgi:hypothetical protein
MAKRKKTKKGGRRRRRVGAFGMGGKDTAIKIAAIAGGFFLGKSVNDKINSLNTKTVPATATTAATTTTVVPSAVITVGELGLGGLLLLRKGGAGTMGMVTKVAGGVLAGVGLRRALGQMGIMAGYQSVPVIGRHRMAGYQSVPVIGANKMPVQLSGKPPAQLQGFRVNGYTPTGSSVGVMGSIGSADNGSGITSSCSSGYMG